MKKVNFVKISPVENMTILVKNDNEFDRAEYKKISQDLMKYKNVFAEQVGFIEENNHLQMMGGEFCGNASRSFATYLAFTDDKFNKEKNYTITCSGSEEELNVWVRQTEQENKFLAKIEMPKAVSVDKEEFVYNSKKIILTKVDFSGIVHFIVESDLECHSMYNFSNFMEKEVGEKYEAFGLMFFDKNKVELNPFVYVKGLGGVWEKSCGSGTTALGYYLKKEFNQTFAKVKQPGGELEVSFEGEKVFIDGEVEISAEGVAYI
ncbi:MAG: diaminopimelate epimerase [Fusobacterium sp.]|nr:diaminopimelate epimerase [Fusobacterium sp.]